MKQLGIVSLCLLVSAVAFMLFGIGSIVSPFYLTGGIIGFSQGDKNINGSGDYTYVISAGFSIVMGVVSCILSLVTGGAAMGTALGAIAGRSSDTTKNPAPPESQADATLPAKP